MDGSSSQGKSSTCKLNLNVFVNNYGKFYFCMTYLVRKACVTVDMSY